MLKKNNNLKQTRPIFEIVKEIRADWEKVNYGAVHLDAMATINKIEESYYYESARTQVIYFCLMRQLGGDVARRVKKNLTTYSNNMATEKQPY
jgi:hypothetical protein